MAQLSEDKQVDEEEESLKKLLSSYLGLSFAIFLGSLPKSLLSLLSVKEELSRKLAQAEDELRQMKYRRREDSRANARVVEIFASQRNTWQEEERRLHRQIDDSAEEIARLRSEVAESERRVEELRREVGEREEMLNFMSRRPEEFSDEENWSTTVVQVEEEKGSCAEESRDCGGEEEGFVDSSRFGKIRVSAMEECYLERNLNGETLNSLYEWNNNNDNNGFDSSEFLASSTFLAEQSSLWQDVQHETLESLYPMKHFVARESPWKVDGESAGVSSKLKILEQELQNLERIGKVDLSKVPSLMRKQTKRYQALTEKIDDLCKRMQASDPCEPNLSSEFRTQRQTEFLLEAFRLQQRASETGQKLIALQTETGKSYLGDEQATHAKLTTRRSFGSIKNNFKDIQRNLEIWLARIIGDLEGILARDGASRVREYYISRYPFVQ